VFEVQPTGTMKYGYLDPSERYESPQYTIFRSDESAAPRDAEPVVDVFRLDYQENLTRSWRNRNIFVQALLLAVTIVMFVFALILVVPRKLKFLHWNWWPHWSRRSNVQWRDLFQLFIVSLLLFAFVAYLAVLVIALVDTIRAAGSDSPELTSSQSLAVIATTFGFASPRALKQRFVDSAVNYLTMTQYLALGARRRSVWGQFTAMLERLCEAGRYETVHVVAFSFGSIVALDALYPPGESPPPRYDQIDAVVTIGAPVDVVRQFRPKYFDGRRSRENGVDYRWHNIFIPSDVLASNLRDDAKTFLDEQQTELAPAQFEILKGSTARNHAYLLEPGGGTTGLAGIVGAFFLAGLNAHQNYWGDRPSEADAFRIVVQSLFGEEPDGPLR
jgi:hypothetical protein